VCNAVNTNFQRLQIAHTTRGAGGKGGHNHWGQTDVSALKMEFSTCQQQPPWAIWQFGFMV